MIDEPAEQPPELRPQKVTAADDPKETEVEPQAPVGLDKSLEELMASTAGAGKRADHIAQPRVPFWMWLYQLSPSRRPRGKARTRFERLGGRVASVCIHAMHMCRHWGQAVHDNTSPLARVRRSREPWNLPRN